MIFTIYLAHPISGYSYSEVVDGYYEPLKKLLTDMGYFVLNPMTGKEYLRNETEFTHDYKNPPSTNHAIIERDHWMVAKADIVLVDFTGSTKVSIGCVMELAWAYHLGKHTVVVINDVHRHSFILEAADIIYETLPDALMYLKALIGKQ